VTFNLGDNDYINAANSIASGALSGGALAAFEQQVANNIDAGVSALQNAGSAVVLGGYANIVHSPAAATIKANPVARANLETALSDGNELVRAVALARGVPYIDFHTLLTQVYDAGVAELGGVELILTGSGSDPHFFWQDPFHAGLLVRGVIANLYIQSINEGYGTSIPLLTDLEILTLAGLEDEYEQDTFDAAYPYASFVTIPEPATWLLATIGLAAMLALAAGRAAEHSGHPRRP